MSGNDDAERFSVCEDGEEVVWADDYDDLRTAYDALAARLAEVEQTLADHPDHPDRTAGDGRVWRYDAEGDTPAPRGRYVRAASYDALALRFAGARCKLATVQRERDAAGSEARSLRCQLERLREIERVDLEAADELDHRMVAAEAHAEQLAAILGRAVAEEGWEQDGAGHPGEPPAWVAEAQDALATPPQREPTEAEADALTRAHRASVRTVARGLTAEDLAQCDRERDENMAAMDAEEREVARRQHAPRPCPECERLRSAFVDADPDHAEAFRRMTAAEAECERLRTVLRESQRIVAHLYYDAINGEEVSSDVLRDMADLNRQYATIATGHPAKEDRAP